MTLFLCPTYVPEAANIGGYFEWSYTILVIIVLQNLLTCGFRTDLDRFSKSQRNRCTDYGEMAASQNTLYISFGCDIC